VNNMTKDTGRVDILGGIRDLCIMALLLVAAGGGGYFYGTFQKVAPVEYVTANTPGAVKPKLPNSAAQEAVNEAEPVKPKSTTTGAKPTEAITSGGIAKVARSSK
jgi:hypothetical protein